MLVCGIILPGLLINAYGSEQYGASASIIQFLSYIALFEGGIGGVARAALYKPLAYNDMEKVSAVLAELRRFFHIIALSFAAYVLVLACGFKGISRTDVLDWGSSFLLVIVISVSTFAEYFIGATNAVLLQASHKTYITNAIHTATTIINVGVTVLLVKLNCSLIVVKLASSCVFLLRPIAQWWYVRRHYKLVKDAPRDKDALKQKWDGLGQHIAYFLYYNTDIALLTLLADLKKVAVYALYNMVVNHIQTLVVSFSSGMEAVFGDMLAKKQHRELNESFNSYETLLSLVGVVLLTVTAVMILPFVKLYTAGVTDTNYIEPVFSVVLSLNAMVYCVRLPYQWLTVAAGHFKQTRISAYAEVLLNVGISIVLIFRFQLLGVAIGTLVSTVFRLVYYAIYLKKYILQRSLWLFAKRMLLNALGFGGIFVFGKFMTNLIPMHNYFHWVLCAAAVGVFALVFMGGIQCLFYWKDVRKLLKNKK